MATAISTDASNFVTNDANNLPEASAPGPATGNVSSVEWPQLGSDTNYLNSDLFGGDLFGDELMDMYSSAVVDAAGPELITSSKADGNFKDGFGAPSSSFNDFSSLFPPTSENGGLVAVASMDTNAPMDSATAAALQVAGVSSPAPVPFIAPQFNVTSADQGSSTDSIAGRKRKDAPGPALPKIGITAASTAGQVVVRTAAQNTVVVGAVAKKTGGGITAKGTNTAGVAARVATTGGVFHQVKPVAEPTVPGGKRPRKSPPTAKKASAANRKAANAKAVAQFAPLAASQVSKFANRTIAVAAPPGVVAPVANAVANPLVPCNEGAVVPPAAAAAQALARPNSPPQNLVAGAIWDASPALVSPGSTQYAAVPPITLSSAQDINAAVAAVALAKANALLNHTKNAAASNIQQTGPKVSAEVPAPMKSAAQPVHAPAPTTQQDAVPHPVISAPAPMIVASNPQALPPSTNTTTAHVAALTSNNWAVGHAAAAQAPVAAAAAPAATPPATKPNAATTACQAQAQKRRAALTPEDRAKQNRDRNREHARNTRLRKKAYVEELKKTLTEIVAQRDALELEKMTEMQCETECRSVRLTVMEEFLKLRGTNVQDYRRWASILEEGFVLTLPQTNYRKMLALSSAQESSKAYIARRVSSSPLHSPATNEAASTIAVPPASSFSQTIHGIQKVMEDSSLLSEMLAGFENLKAGTPYCGLTFDCQQNRFMMDASNHSAVVDWTARTEGATSQGAAHELVLTGNMRATFHSATNKLLSVELSFDTNVVASQLQSMYPLSFCENHGQHSSDADATAALLDSLNVPQLEGLISSTAGPLGDAHYHASTISSDEHNESDSSEATQDAYNAGNGVTRKKAVQAV
jgi:hypothetical protein